jgi:hypothetical protein
MPGNPLTDPNWAPELADTIERAVGKVRDAATAKAVTAVRALVFGIVIGFAAFVAVVLGVILAVKLLQRVVNIGGWIDADSSVWVSYLVMGAVLALAGAWCMKQRTAKAGVDR